MTPQRILAACALCSALLVAACCQSSPPPAVRSDPAGLQEQRDLIARAFDGLDPGDVNFRAAGSPTAGRQAVSAAWWGFDPENATSSLQSSLDSGAPLVLVPAMASPWVTDPLLVRSHTTIILQEGAQVVSRKGGFQHTDDSLLKLKDVQDVTIQGYGARLVMRKEDYRRPPYEKSEWRHAIELYGCSDVRILGLQADSSGGDGVYLGSGDTQDYNRGVLLKDLTLRDHFRQAISVISAEDLRIENVEMAMTEGTPPSAGIDFEPNYPAERLVRCVLNRCVIRSNRGAGISVVLKKMDGTSRPVDIRVEDSSVSDNFFSLLLWGAQNVAGRIELVHTTLRGLQLVGPGQRVTITRD
jgi:hypothetical protein